MTKSIRLLCLSILVVTGLSTYAQTAKVAADTGKLKIEYVQLTNEIANLNTQLTMVQNSLPAYQLKVKATRSNAETIISSAGDQASKAFDGNTSKASALEAKAKKAYEENSKAAIHNLNNQHDKITILASEINKKQQRLQELHAAQTIM